MIERIEDKEGFEKLREEWSQLLQASASNCLFLTWEWLYTWWKHLSEGRSLFIIAVRSGRELVALAPFALRHIKPSRILPFCSLEFLGTGSVGSDYLDLIIRQGKEHEALQALVEYLVKEKLVHRLDQLKRNSCLAQELAERLRRRGWSVCEEKTDICPFINLSGHSWESYLKTLGPEHRYNFKRRLGKLKQQSEVRFEQVASEKQRREALEALITLHQMRWQGRGGSTAFHTAGLLSFHEEFSRLALERDWLRLFVLRIGGKPVASLYGFRYQRIFSFYQSGFDPDYGKFSVGLIMMGLAIKNAIEEGAEEYDLLHGAESYKTHWASAAHELGRIEIYPNSAYGLLHRKAAGLSRNAKKMARRVLPQAVIDTLVVAKQARMLTGSHAS